jgi:tetraacyldisaccharide 4'-kinase
MGGTGKTPFVLWLCGKLRELGRRPAVLTRGYRRRPGERMTVVVPGEAADVATTGEEAQLYLRAGLAVGISADRHAAGRALLADGAAEVFVLDDGFQHWSLGGKIEIVLVDALDPFRGGVFPVGRLREPLEALDRADAVVITRIPPGRRYPALEKEIRRHNSRVPIFHAWLEAERQVARRGAIGAFCGLGQPESFLGTLRGLGIEPVVFGVFPDHHRYREEDLAPLARACDTLLTTEKDLFHIEPEVAKRLRISAAGVRMVLGEEEEFMNWLRARLG